MTPADTSDRDVTGEHASLCSCADAVSLRRELATIFGPVKPRRGQTWNEAMLGRITEQLDAERESGYQEGLDDERL